MTTDIGRCPSGRATHERSRVSPSPPSVSVPNAIAATFEFAGKAIAMLAFTFAVILAAPFMLLGWLLYCFGWEL